jgi:hypothetical protein
VLAKRKLEKVDGQPTPTLRFLCDAKNVGEKRRMTAGRKHGAATIRAFDTAWNSAGEKL